MSDEYRERLDEATKQIEPKGASQEAWHEYREAFRDWSGNLERADREHTR